ncbi:MAG: DMT family transporter [Bacteroidales bacterium]
MRKNFKTYLILIVAVALWGVSFIWTKMLLEVGYEPITIVFIRLLLATIFFLPLFIWSKNFQKIAPSDMKVIALAALFEPFIYFLGENYGLKLVSPEVASIIIATIPVLTPVFTYIFLKEKFAALNIVGMLISFTGVALMITNGDFVIEVSLSGVLLLFVAVLSAIGYAITTRKLSLKYSVTTIVFYQTWIGLIYFLPFFLLFSLSNMQSVPLQWNLIFAFVALAALCSILAFLGYIYGIQKLGANKAGMFTNLIPVVTVVLSYFVLESSFTIQKLIGISCVILGLFATQLKFVNKKRSKE